ncbi:copper transporter [Krasilnikoviella flava]|uniref:Copper transport outer membrane protein, MctB n=1 Tax=Krasilnikoviella flava TaxID=526729 RepID=A0A1T5M2S1_9MICO|nr:copper transporter [Krasilnikoviella flava]SKC82425.1 Copper transport outer membrane protein, MctB [Krasilnikoviella flava]
MIDFRYHLVSLISVFLALAVGIILGAGPLQGALGDQLTEQVDALRTERNTLREELGEAQAAAQDQRRFIESSGDQLVAGSLAGKNVAVVEVDDVSDASRQAVLDELEAADGTVVAQERLTASWTSADELTMRETVADGLREKLPSDAVEGTIDDESGPAQLLAASLTVALTDATAAQSSTFSDAALEQQHLLEQVGLVEQVAEPSAPADAILLLSGGGTVIDEDAQTQDADPEQTGMGALAALAGTSAEIAGTSVVAGPTTQDGDLVATVRADDQLAELVSTVSGVEQTTGQIVVPLAIAAQDAGAVDQYGFEDGASVLPPVVEQGETQGNG